MEEALAIERSLPGWPLRDGPTRARCEQLYWSADPGARAFLQTVRATVATQDDPAVAGSLLWFEAVSEWRAGNWEEADRCAVESFDLFTQLGRLHAPYELPAALIAAHRGRLDDARARAVGRDCASGGRRNRSCAVGARLGPRLHRALGRRHRGGARPPATVVRDPQRFHPRTGSAARARRPARGPDRNRRARRGRRASSRLGKSAPAASTELGRLRSLPAVVGSCSRRGAISMAPSRASSTRSPSMPEAPIRSITHGRCSPSAERSGARRSAAPHERPSRTHSRASSSSAPRSGPSRPAPSSRASAAVRASNGELTEAERRIALLVAEGRTNREVAAALFLTVHSVETTLTRVYRKLEVRSRAELARLFAANS